MDRLMMLLLLLHRSDSSAEKAMGAALERARGEKQHMDLWRRVERVILRFVDRFASRSRRE